MSLEVKDLTFRYGKKEPAILEAFSAAFAKGKMTSITGPNGAGKTTLSRVIMGILKPETGSVFLDGKDIKDWSLAERGKRIGYVMQNPARQIFSPTVSEEMEYGLCNLGLDEDEVGRRSREFLRMFDLNGYEDTFPFHLSHGEKQRLVLAAVLAMRPDYLMLDEPTAGLDKKRKKQLGRYLEDVKEQTACGIILISHDLEFLRAHEDCRISLGGDADVPSRGS